MAGSPYGAIREYAIYCALRGLAEVEAGEEVIITRRGKPVARIVPEPAAASSVFDLAALRAFVQAEPCREDPTVADMREQDLL
jgi:antitoxin (DNA-binding transcriptional repressor) of toxin-antitoxin stability system